MPKKIDIVIDDINRIAEEVYPLASVLENSTFLITGGSGFLGRYVTDTISWLNRNCFRNPCYIISVDNNITSSPRDNMLMDSDRWFTFIKHDITKPINIPGQIDFIMHAAGIASPIYYSKYQLETIDVAVTGTRNVLELAREKRSTSMLFFSSSEIYGNPSADAIPTKETYNGNVSSIGPRSCYDESKRLGEALCMSYLNVDRIPIKITRPFNIFGPRMKPKDYRVIPSFICHALNGKTLRVHASGSQTRTFCYISDAIIGFFRILLSTKNGEVYNIGNDDREITINELANCLNEIFNYQLNITNIDYPENYPKDEPQRRCPDLSKARACLGYKATIDLTTGLERTVEWCMHNWESQK